MDLEISLDALKLAYHECGWGEMPNGWAHEKTVPYMIVAQPTAGAYEITSAGQTARVEYPEAFLTPALQPLRIVHHGDAKNYFAARWLHFSFVMFETIEISSVLQMPLKIDAATGQAFGAMIEELFRLKKTQAATTLTRITRERELLWRAMRLVCEQSKPCPDRTRQLRSYHALLPALTHLRKHLAEPVTVQLLADLACMSTSQFFAYFGEQMGCSPMVYLKKLRLNEAAFKLASTDWPLKQIANRVGFSNPFHLSREFKRQFHHSPAEYRKLTSAAYV